MTFGDEPGAPLVTCEASHGWLVFQRAGQFVCISGGLVMLVAAVAAHRAASIPLILIGGGWLLIGLLGARQYRRSVRRMTFDGVLLRFSMIGGDEDVVALADIWEFKWARYDVSRQGPIRAVTTGRTFRVASHSRGLIDLFVALRAADPTISLPV